MACLRRWLGGLAALAWLTLSLAAAAQEYKEEDPIPPDAKGAVLELKTTVLDLKGTVVEIKGAVLPLRGAVTPLGGRVDPVAAALKDLGARIEGNRIKIDLAADILFDFDKADLRPAADVPLGKVAAVLKAYPRASTLIEGHTDGRGADQYNQRLSERRAESVRRWLLAHQMKTRITARGWGKRKPVAPNTHPDGRDNPEGRQKNRRVEITVRTQ